MVQTWSRIISLPLLAASVLTYALGAGIADYLGYSPDGWNYFIGQGIVLLILASSKILFEYFEHLKKGVQPFSRRTPEDKADNPSPQTLLIMAVVLLTFIVLLGYTLSRNVNNVGLMFLQLALLILLSLLFIGQGRCVYSGYGELAQGLILCCLIPTFAFSIQYGDVHRILLLATFPLIFLFLAVRFALELESYDRDLKANRFSLLIRLGWQRGVLFHHIFLILVFLLLAIATLFGLAWRLVWPALLAMPLALFEIWLINRIALGLPPRWFLVKVSAGITFSLPVYLLAITFWLT